MSYTIKLNARSEREAMINKSVENPLKLIDFYDFRNAKYQLPEIRIDINIPIYRMENFRTFTDQKEYIANNEKDSGFFIKGQESESCQQIQHELLASLSRKGKSESVTPVIDVLRKEKQREAILISSTGVVINGNRRLAAMRELLEEDPAANSDFTHINCMVLPADATAEEILDIEASLQAKPETKLDYDWIGDGQLISKLLAGGRTTSDLSEKLNRSKKEIENSVQALAEAEMYLKDWAHAPGEYSRIRDDAEQLFKDLPKRLDGKDQALQSASRAIAWSLFENRDKLPGRIYDFNAAFGGLASDVLERLSESLGIECVASPDESDESFSIEIDDEDQVVYDSLIEALQDEESKEDAVDALIEACQGAIETEKGQKSGEAALKAITQAHSKLAGVDLSAALPKTYPGIRKQLEAINALSNKLLGDLSNYEK